MTKHGLFSWADLACPDPAKGAAFYGAVFGWDHDEIPNAGGYGFFTKDGKKASGIGPLTEEQQAQGQPPTWSAYVAVDSVDDVVAKAKAAGANVVLEPMDVMDAGRMAFIFDPVGAALGFWQAKEHTGADAYNESGFMTWNELHTRDVAKAKQFYSDVLPWSLDTQDMGGMEYTMIMLDGNTNGGMMAIPAEAPAQMPSYWATYFRVDDADATAQDATANGGTVLRPASDSPYGRMVVIADPFGAAFAAIGPAPQQ